MEEDRSGVIRLPIIPAANRIHIHNTISVTDRVPNSVNIQCFSTSDALLIAEGGVGVTNTNMGVRRDITQLLSARSGEIEGGSEECGHPSPLTITHS